MSGFLEIRLPDIGGATDVEVIELLVRLGDEVRLEQALMSVEYDKATMEIPSPAAGRLVELSVAEGDKVSEGVLIALLEPSEAVGQLPTLDSATADADNQVKSETALTMPSSRLSDRYSGAGTGNQNAVLSASTAKGSSSLDEKVPPYSSPSIRRLARELNVYLPEVTGGGARGRITRADVMGHVRGMMRARRTTSSAETGTNVTVLPGILPWPKVDFEKFGPVERRELSRIRKISGANLHRNWVSIPHVTNHEDADITDLEAFRLQMNAEHAKSGVKVTLLALLIKACVAALKKFPDFNASLDGDYLVLKGYCHIGFAADTPNGLVVPVIRDADQKGVMDIAGEVSTLAAKARDGRLTADQMSGGCFSISSLGGIGGSYFTPIINAPEVAILGVSKARHQMIWNGEAAEPRLILPLSLSWDHRVIDGAVAGRFNAYLASVLADMRRAMM